MGLLSVPHVPENEATWLSMSMTASLSAHAENPPKPTTKLNNKIIIFRTIAVSSFP
jgi:hypothetical protein